MNRNRNGYSRISNEILEYPGRLSRISSLREKASTESFMNRKLKFRCSRCKNSLAPEEKGHLCNKCTALAAKLEKEERLEYIRAHIEELLMSRGVPKRYFDCKLDNFQTTDVPRKKALRVAKGYTEKLVGSGEGLFLTGTNGAGKTHLAVAVMRELILRDHLSCYFIKLPELLLDIRERIGNGASEKEVIQGYKDYDYLFLDELGVEKVSEWVLQDLYLILDGRNGALKPTIITSNLGLDEIEEHIGSRFVSRIVEMCKSVAMEFEDWRKITRRRKLSSTLRTTRKGK